MQEEHPIPLPHGTRLEFTGQGEEYFRIWVVNTTLNLLTLGIYSPWAKVRKARWFAQHTRLDDDAFDFHGDPRRILIGRLLALVLLLAYRQTFQFSAAAGFAVLALIYIAGPLLFVSAQRFRLSNTSWRGLRFGFSATSGDAYACCLPWLILFTVGTAVTALHPEPTAITWVAFASLLPWPWAHARLKRLQHSRASFGATPFACASLTADFYGCYLGAAILGIAVGVIGIALSVAAIATGQSATATWIIVIVMMAMLLKPYLSMRLQQSVWSATRWNGLRFRNEMQLRRLWPLVARAVVFTVATGGLYWPFAAVALARFRVTSLVVESATPLSEIVGRAPATAAGTAGDAVADLFNLDLGW